MLPYKASFQSEVAASLNMVVLFHSGVGRARLQAADSRVPFGVPERSADLAFAALLERRPVRRSPVRPRDAASGHPRGRAGRPRRRRCSRSAASRKRYFCSFRVSLCVCCTDTVVGGSIRHIFPCSTSAKPKR